MKIIISNVRRLISRKKVQQKFPIETFRYTQSWTVISNEHQDALIELALLGVSPELIQAYDESIKFIENSSALYEH